MNEIFFASFFQTPVYTLIWINFIFIIFNTSNIFILFITQNFFISLCEFRKHSYYDSISWIDMGTRSGNTHTGQVMMMMIILNSIQTSPAILSLILIILFLLFKSRLNILIYYKYNIDESNQFDSIKCIDCYYFFLKVF